MSFLEDILAMKDERPNIIDPEIENIINSLERNDTVEVEFHLGYYSSSTIGYFVKNQRESMVLSRDRRPKGLLFSFLSILHRQYVPYDAIKDVHILERYNPCNVDRHAYELERLQGCDDYDRQYELRLH